MLATCPTDPSHKQFVTSAHVMEDWIVDERGSFVRVKDTLETVHGPDLRNTWTCADCGTEAEVTGNH